MRNQKQNAADPSRIAIWRRCITAFVFVSILYVFAFHLWRNEAAFWAALLLFPFLSGVAVQVIIDPLIQKPLRTVFGFIWGVLGALAIVLMIVQLETLICFAIALPFLVGLPWLGMFVIRSVLTPISTDLRNSAQLPVLVVAAAAALLAPPLEHKVSFESVENTIWIEAKPQTIWAHIVDFPQVRDEERLWTIAHNLLGAPVPNASKLLGDVRTAHWSQGVTYQELVTNNAAPSELDWTFSFAPDFRMDGLVDHISPDSRQLKLLDGHYRLEPTNGGTRVTLVTNYRLSSLFNSYVSLWGERFLSDNHSSILHVLKLRSETTL